MYDWVSFLTDWINSLTGSVASPSFLSITWTRIFGFHDPNPNRLSLSNNNYLALFGPFLMFHIRPKETNPLAFPIG